jgi:hypothetical protein
MCSIDRRTFGNGRENVGYIRVDHVPNALGNRLHVHVTGGLDSSVPQMLLHIFHAPALLISGCERTAQDLERDEPRVYTQAFGDRFDAAFKKVATAQWSSYG